MRRILTLLSLVLAFSLVAAACGDDDSTTTAGSDDTGELPVNDEPDSDLPDDDLPVDDEPVEEPGDDVDEPIDGELPLGGGPYPIADITVVLDITETEEEPVTYRLACLGDTATFTGDVPAGVDAAAACLAIATDEARALLDPNLMIDRACTEIYGGPETALITGTLDDMTVEAEINRTNGCGIDDWGRVFAGLLPAVG